MKSLIRNNKAVAVPLAIAIIAIIIVVAFAYVYSGSGSKEYFETETDFGMWEEEFFVTFEDGTEKSLKIIDEQKDMPFTVRYGGTAITSMGMKIRATPSGTGYDGAELKFTSFGLEDRIRNSAWTTLTTYDSIRSDTTIQLVMDYPNDIISSTFNLNNLINGHPEIYPDGTYYVSFTPTGTVKYRGYPDGGEWLTATLPQERTATIYVSDQPVSGTILITLSSELFVN